MTKTVTSRSGSARRRLVFCEIFNASMTMAMAFGIYVLTELLLAPGGMRPWGGVLRMLPCALAYPAGRLLRRLKPQTAIALGLAISAALAAVPLALMYTFSLSWAFMAPILFVSTMALYIIPFICGSNLLHPPQFIIGVIIFLICVAAINISGNRVYSLPINATAIVFLCVGLYVFNRENLRNETSPDGKRTKLPTGIRRQNLIYLAIVIIVALLLANAGAVRQVIVDGVITIVAAVTYFLDWLGRVMGIGTGGGGGGSTGMADNPLLEGEEHIESRFEQIFWQVVLIVIIVALCAAIVYLLIKVAKKLSGKLPSLWEKLFGLKQQENEYIDETEDLAGQNLGSILMDRLKQAAGKLKRPPRFEDMPDNREKVRFVYKRALGRLNSRKRDSVAMTPTELAPDIGKLAGGRNSSGADTAKLADEFVNIYNLARYSQEEISDADAEVARGINRRV